MATDTQQAGASALVMIFPFLAGAPEWATGAMVTCGAVLACFALLRIAGLGVRHA